MDGGWHWGRNAWGCCFQNLRFYCFCSKVKFPYDVQLYTTAHLPTRCDTSPSCRKPWCSWASLCTATTPASPTKVSRWTRWCTRRCSGSSPCLTINFDNGDQGRREGKWGGGRDRNIYVPHDVCAKGKTSSLHLHIIYIHQDLKKTITNRNAQTTINVDRTFFLSVVHKQSGVTAFAAKVGFQIITFEHL